MSLKGRIAVVTVALAGLGASPALATPGVTVSSVSCAAVRSGARGCTQPHRPRGRRQGHGPHPALRGRGQAPGAHVGARAGERHGAIRGRGKAAERAEPRQLLPRGLHGDGRRNSAARRPRRTSASRAARRCAAAPSDSPRRVHTPLPRTAPRARARWPRPAIASTPSWATAATRASTATSSSTTTPPRTCSCPARTSISSSARRSACRTSASTSTPTTARAPATTRART